MATDESIRVHPGDIVQDSDGLFFLVTETHSWGVGAVQRDRVPGGLIREAYFRLKPGQFVPVGVAHTLPEEVAQARRDSLALERQLAADALADPDDLTPQWDVEVRFNGRTSGSGQRHSERVRAESVEDALRAARLPLTQHGGAAFIVGATVDEVRPHPALAREPGK